MEVDNVRLYWIFRLFKFGVAPVASQRFVALNIIFFVVFDILILFAFSNKRTDVEVLLRSVQFSARESRSESASLLLQTSTQAWVVVTIYVQNCTVSKQLYISHQYVLSLQ